MQALSQLSYTPVTKTGRILLATQCGCQPDSRRLQPFFLLTEQLLNLKFKR